MLLKKWVLSFMYLVSVDPMDWSVIYKCFQEDLMEGVIREEDREDREANKEDDIEYQIGLLGLVPPSGDLVE